MIYDKVREFVLPGGIRLDMLCNKLRHEIVFELSDCTDIMEARHNPYGPAGIQKNIFSRPQVLTDADIEKVANWMEERVRTRTYSARGILGEDYQETFLLGLRCWVDDGRFLMPYSGPMGSDNKKPSIRRAITQLVIIATQNVSIIEETLKTVDWYDTCPLKASIETVLDAMKYPLEQFLEMHPHEYFVLLEMDRWGIIQLSDEMHDNINGAELLIAA